jgi:hypothetical protein
MASLIRDQIVQSLVDSFKAQKQRHMVNVEVMLNNPMAIPEHGDLLAELEKEIEKIAEYSDKIEAAELFL